MSYVANYPGGGPVSSPVTHPPASVRNALTAMLAGACLTVVSFAFNMVEASRILARDTVAVGSQLQALHAVLWGSLIIGGLIDTGLWLWIAWASRAGHNWARITGTVFFGVASLSLVTLALPTVIPVAKVLQLLTWAAGLAAVISLWRPESTAFFNLRRAGRYGGPGYGPGYGPPMYASPGHGYTPYPPPPAYPPTPPPSPGAPPPGGWQPGGPPQGGGNWSPFGR